MALGRKEASVGNLKPNSSVPSIVEPNSAVRPAHMCDFDHREVRAILQADLATHTVVSFTGGAPCNMDTTTKLQHSIAAHRHASHVLIHAGAAGLVTKIWSVRVASCACLSDGGFFAPKDAR